MDEWAAVGREREIEKESARVVHIRKYWQMSEKLCAVTRLFLINNLNAISNLEDIHIFFFFLHLQSFGCRHHFRAMLPKFQCCAKAYSI